MLRRQVVPFVLAASLVAAGCDGESSGPLQVRENAFTWSGPVAQGSTVYVRDFNGGIEVKPSADDTVRVTARLEWRSSDPDKYLHFSGGSDGTNIVICATWGDGACNARNYSANVKLGKGSDAKVYFTVQVPAGRRIEITNISGDVSAVASAPVKAVTMNGDVRVATSVGPVQGETLNGSVDIRMSSLVGTDSVIAKTLNGQAFIYLPSVTDAVLELGVGNGSVESAFPETATVGAGTKKIHATIGAGTRVISAYALNGEVALRKLDAEGKAP